MNQYSYINLILQMIQVDDNFKIISSGITSKNVSSFILKSLPSNELLEVLENKSEYRNLSKAQIISSFFGNNNNLIKLVAGLKKKLNNSLLTKDYYNLRSQAEEIQQELASLNKDYELPDIPKKITEASINRIKKYTEDDFIKNKIKRQERSKRIKNKYSIITSNFYNWIVEDFGHYAFFDDFYIEWVKRVAPNDVEYIGKAIEKAFPSGYNSYYVHHYRTNGSDHFYIFLADVIAEIEKSLDDILPSGLPNYSEESAEITQDEYNVNELDYDTVLKDKNFQGYFTLSNGKRVYPFTGEIIKDE